MTALFCSWSLSSSAIDWVLASLRLCRDASLRVISSLLFLTLFKSVFSTVLRASTSARLFANSASRLVAIESLFSSSMILLDSCLKASALPSSAAATLGSAGAFGDVGAGANPAKGSSFFEVPTPCTPELRLSAGVCPNCLLAAFCITVIFCFAATNSSRDSSSCTVSSLRSLFSVKFSSSLAFNSLLASWVSFSLLSATSVSSPSCINHGNTALRSNRVVVVGIAARPRTESTMLSLTNRSGQEKQMQISLVPSGKALINSARATTVLAKTTASRSASRRISCFSS
mmetsp:Transcript_12903/g.22641  ORF Transcript_12903/g.22641 Transcript_12903/m.22641 type:complete len:287 (-) Transcript_12903:433-1293(-)